jgi:hypothetical protein
VIAGVRGSREARAAARDLRKAAARDLTREIRSGMNDAVRTLQPLLVVSAVAVMPRGYGRVLAPAMRTRFVTKVQTASRVGIFVTISAMGRREHRDVSSLNRGTLRHPLFGNRRHWYAQRVRPGFVDQPVQRLRPVVIREVDAACSRVAAQVERGH